MASCKPLIQTLMTFSKAKKLELRDLHLQKLQMMAIDNFIVVNDNLKHLSLVNVKMTSDMLRLLEGSFTTSKSITTLKLSSNPLRNVGARDVARILTKNTSIQKIDISACDIRQEGIVAILSILRDKNRTLTSLIAE